MLYEKFRCEACVKKFPLFRNMSEFPEDSTGIEKMLDSAGFNFEEAMTLLYFISHVKLPYEEMKHKMESLLKSMHTKDLRLNQLYWMLQECIKNYYRTQGNCNFHGDSKNIVTGKKKFDTQAAEAKLPQLRATAKYIHIDGIEYILS
jgi:hypothetical protein